MSEVIVHPDLLKPEDLPVDLGRYRLLKILGEGGMARVFKAQLTGPSGFRKMCALKVIHGRVAGQDDAIRNALVNEARLGGLLHHPNVVDTYDFGEFSGQPYIAMELVDGLALDRLLYEFGHLPLSVVFDIGAQVCSGLEHAHNVCDEDGTAAGLVHRDLKPGNIMLSRSGAVKVLDFGIAKSLALGGSTTATGFAKGSPSYMSPQQMKADPLDRRSDIFAMGAVLFILAMGRILFAGKTPASILMQIVQVEQTLAQHRLLEPLFELNSDLGAIVQQCLREEPENRFDTAQTLRKALVQGRRNLPDGEELEEFSTRFFEERAGRLGLTSNSVDKPPLVRPNSDVLATNPRASVDTPGPTRAFQPGGMAAASAEPGEVSLEEIELDVGVGVSTSLSPGATPLSGGRVNPTARLMVAGDALASEEGPETREQFPVAPVESSLFMWGTAADGTKRSVLGPLLALGMFSLLVMAGLAYAWVQVSAPPSSSASAPASPETDPLPLQDASSGDKAPSSLSAAEQSKEVDLDGSAASDSPLPGEVDSPSAGSPAASTPKKTVRKKPRKVAKKRSPPRASTAQARTRPESPEPKKSRNVAVVGEASTEQRDRLDSYRSGREKRVSSRKEDFRASRKAAADKPKARDEGSEKTRSTSEPPRQERSSADRSRAASSLTLSHRRKIRQARVGSTVRFELDASGARDIQGQLRIRRAGGDWQLRRMTRSSSGALFADVTFGRDMRGQCEYYFVASIPGVKGSSKTNGSRKLPYQMRVN